jgi:hypothetical protein
MTDATEGETHLNMTADDRQHWQVASNDPVLQARLERIGAVTLSVAGATRFYRLRADQVLLRRGKRTAKKCDRSARR